MKRCLDEDHEFNAGFKHMARTLSIKDGTGVEHCLHVSFLFPARHALTKSPHTQGSIINDIDQLPRVLDKIIAAKGVWSQTRTFAMAAA